MIRGGFMLLPILIALLVAFHKNQPLVSLVIDSRGNILVVGTTLWLYL